MEEISLSEGFYKVDWSCSILIMLLYNSVSAACLKIFEQIQKGRFAQGVCCLFFWEVYISSCRFFWNPKLLITVWKAVQALCAGRWLRYSLEHSCFTLTSFGAQQEKDVDKSETIQWRAPRTVGAGSLGLQIQPEGMGLAQPGVEITQHLQGGYQQ